MTVALVPYRGTGQMDADVNDPFMPDIARQVPLHAIDLRPDLGVVDGLAVVSCPREALPVDALIIGDGPDAPLGLLMRQRIGNKLGVAVESTRLGMLLMELLVLHATPVRDKRRWNPLRPSGGVFEVWLGGLVAAMPVVQGGSVGIWQNTIYGSSVSDAFTRANNAALGLSWTEVTDANFQITSNQADRTNGLGSARWEADLKSSDNWAQCTVIHNGTLSHYGGPACRFATAADTCYSAVFFNESGDAAFFSVKTIRRVAAAHTTIADTGLIGSPGGTQVMYVEAWGSRIVAKRGGVVASTVTDSGIVTGLRSGILVSSNGLGRVLLDNWSAGDLASNPRPRVVGQAIRRSAVW